MSKQDDKTAASERAYMRAEGILTKAGIAPKSYGIGATGFAEVNCVDAAQALDVAKLTGGRLARAGEGYAPATVLVKP